MIGKDTQGSRQGSSSKIPRSSRALAVIFLIACSTSLVAGLYPGLGSALGVGLAAGGLALTAIVGVDQMRRTNR